MGASLNLKQTLTGSFASPGGGISAAGNPTSQWQLNPIEFALWDQNGIDRIAMGNLPAAGISPAGFLFRAKDQNGNPIFDSMGLIAVMQSLGSATATNATVTAATPTLITGTAVTFMLVRQASIIVFYIANCSESSVGAQNAQILSFIDGVDQTSGGNPGFGLAWAPTSAGSQTASAWYSKQLGAGSHTADCRGFVTGTASLSVLACQCSVYLQGT